MASEGNNEILKWLLGTAAIFVIIYGLRISQEVIVPVLLSAFFSVVLSSPLLWLRQRGWGVVAATVAVMAAALLLVIFLILLIASSFYEFNERIPFYQERIQAFWTELEGIIPIGGSAAEFFDYFEPAQLVSLLSALFDGLSSAMGNAFLVIFTALLILLESDNLGGKFARSDGSAPPVIAHLVTGIRKYLVLKTAISLATGFVAWALCAVLGVDFPLLWGLLAFLLNYIPNIGSILAAIPPVVIAAVHLDLEIAAYLALGYVAINMVIGNVIEPRLMGQGMGLSTLVVFVSMLFWGWVLGPVGLLLSVPLTLVLKLTLDLSPSSKRFADLLAA